MKHPEIFLSASSFVDDDEYINKAEMALRR
jgi:hypothetical protein